MFKMVVIKLIAPSIEEIPARWRLKMARSTEPPECDWTPARGGYTVQPVPQPCSTKLLASRRANEGGSNQKLMLFSLGNAMSTAPMSKGTQKFPKPPINAGMTRKKIITNACAVTITL
jgi:hypothetical protein